MIVLMCLEFGVHQNQHLGFVSFWGLDKQLDLGPDVLNCSIYVSRIVKAHAAEFCRFTSKTGVRAQLMRSHWKQCVLLMVLKLFDQHLSETSKQMKTSKWKRSCDVLCLTSSQVLIIFRIRSEVGVVIPLFLCIHFLFVWFLYIYFWLNRCFYCYG